MGVLRFKAKDSQTNEWIYGTGIVIYENEDAFIIERKSYRVIPKTICQSTGNKADKDKGAEIYENDRIIWNSKVWTVIWNDDYAAYVIERNMFYDEENKTVRFDCDVAWESKLVGNRYD